VTVGEGDAPVVAVLLGSAKEKGRRVRRCPQRARTPGLCGFPLANRLFSGDRRKGATIAIVDPPGKPDAVTVGEGDAPVVAVLLGSAKADEPISAFKGAPFPHPPMLGLTMRFAATRRRRRGAMIVPSQPCRRKPCPRWGSTSRVCKFPAVDARESLQPCHQGAVATPLSGGADRLRIADL
jgi:hypothetical protein